MLLVIINGIMAAIETSVGNPPTVVVCDWMESASPWCWLSWGPSLCLTVCLVGVHVIIHPVCTVQHTYKISALFTKVTGSVKTGDRVQGTLSSERKGKLTFKPHQSFVQ